jgi:hypothetical protein
MACGSRQSRRDVSAPSLALGARPWAHVSSPIAVRGSAGPMWFYAPGPTPGLLPGVGRGGIIPKGSGEVELVPQPSGEVEPMP